MEKLELKHLAPYLPYNLRLKNIGETYHDLIGLCNKIEGNEDVPCDFIVDELQNEYYIEGVKPILRPMSDLMPGSEYKFLNKPDVELLGRKITSPASEYWGWVAFQEKKMGWNKPILDFEYWFVDLLLKHHFDVFGLIDKGLAIHINSVT